MTVNHGGEPGHQRNNIFDNHPQRRKRWYHRSKPKVASTDESLSVSEDSAPEVVKGVFRKSLQITTVKVISFNELPAWIKDTFSDILLDKHAASMDRLGIWDIQPIFQYILGVNVPIKTAEQGQLAVEFSIPGTNLKSIVTVTDATSCFA